MGAFIAVSASLMTPVAAACVVLHGRQKDATGNAAGVPADAGLLEVISMVESKSNDSAIGDNGRALGRYQIWACYVADVNRIAGTSYSHSDVHNPAKARAMVETYLEHYGKRYAKKTGKKPTMEVLCRIHNGGPDGWKKDSTLPYWEKCKKAQRQLNRRTKK